jgi:hypothetical protein
MCGPGLLIRHRAEIKSPPLGGYVIPATRTRTLMTPGVIRVLVLVGALESSTVTAFMLLQYELSRAHDLRKLVFNQGLNRVSMQIMSSQELYTDTIGT